MEKQARSSLLFAALILSVCSWSMAALDEPPLSLKPFFSPPTEVKDQLGPYRSPLIFNDGRVVKTPADWQLRRTEILDFWHKSLGPWPPLLDNPKLQILASGPRENFIQHRVTLQSAPTQTLNGYLLIPSGAGPFPAVLVVYYDPETSIGTNPTHLQRDFAYQLTKRGFVTLSIGSPGGDARKPELGQAICQPLSYLAYVAANAHTALAHQPMVDPKRIGVVGHSYGGKWAMFASCLYDKFAAAVWSDPGIVFDEARGNINYWEPWYLGFDPNQPPRKRGLITPQSPRTGPYKTLMESGHDLHELHALMAPRPFLVSGGAEDTPKRWIALNHTVAINTLLGARNRVAMTNRKDHPPTDESNAQLYAFFDYALK